METLQFEYRNGRPVAGSPSATLTGVVGSGNLDVLVEPAELGGTCRIEILTAAVGFGPIWQAVLDDFFTRHPLARSEELASELQSLAYLVCRLLLEKKKQ